MKAGRVTIMSLGLWLAASLPAAAQKTDNVPAADIAAIQQVREDLDAAYNRRDAAAFSKIFLEEADFQWQNGALLKNREEIRQHFTNEFRSIPAEFRHITTFQRLRLVRPDIAIGDGTVVIAREGAAATEKPFMKVLLICVGKKVDGQWRIAAVRLIPMISE